MVSRDARRKLSSAGFLAVGVVGVFFSALTFGAGGVLYVLLFGTFALAGIAVGRAHTGYAAATLLAGAALATVLGVGRTAVLGALDGLAVAFLAMGVTSGWKGYRYYEARG